ncbi:MAG: acyltransferase [Phaeobacter gallaeciensis]
MINVLQAGRFLAALAVVLLHAGSATSAFVAPPPAGVRFVLGYGYLGVDFFFALSGFIIHYTMTTAPRSLADFAYGRLTRIMLPYWPIGLTLAVAYVLLPDLSASGRAWGWLPTLTLIPSQHPPALGVAWTLQHELLFYLLYGLLLALRKLPLGLVIWGGMIALASPFEWHRWPLLAVLLDPVNIEFLAGVLAAHVVVSDRGGAAGPYARMRTIAWAAGSVAVCVAGFVALGADKPDRWLIGVGCACVLPVLYDLERAGRINVPGWLVFGGAMSYALYLIHNPLISLVARAAGGLGLGWLPAFAAMVGTGLLAGALYHLWWEKPVLRRARRAWARNTS